MAVAVMDRVEKKSNINNSQYNLTVRRQELWMADLGQGYGSEQGGVRPVLVIQNNRGNIHSPTIQVIPLTSSLTKARTPTHADIPALGTGLYKDSIALCEQQRAIDKKRLRDKIGVVDSQTMRMVDRCIDISNGRIEKYNLVG